MRSLLIAVALLLPVGVIVGLSEKMPPAPAIYHDSKKFEEITSKVKPAPEANNTVPEKVRPGSLEEAKQRLRKRLAELEKMTEQQWQKQKRNRNDFGKRWNKLSDEKKLQAIEKMQEKKQEGGRVPVIKGAPANPPGDLPAQKPDPSS